MINDSRPLISLRNIGATLALKLHSIGIHSEADLRREGSVTTFRRLVKRYPSARTAIWFYLFSLEGALLNLPWRLVPRERARTLLRELAS